MSSPPMIGGDIKLPDLSIVTSNLQSTLAGLSGLSSFAKFSSFEQITSLSTDQIAALVRQIDVLIGIENKNIIDSQTMISILQETIDNPVTGYQHIYDSTMKAYSSAVLSYNAQQSIVNATSLRLSSLYGQLSTVLFQEGYDMSTLAGFEAQYSTFMMEIQINNSRLNSELASYQAMSTTMGSYVNHYAIMLSSFNVELDAAVRNTLSSTMASDLRNENELQPYIVSTLRTISTLSFISSNYADDVNIYTSSYGPYAAMRDQAISSIADLMARQASITSSIGGYDAQLHTLQIASIQEFATLRSDVQTFYTDKRTQIQNALMSVQYYIQEWDSLIGYIVSELMITKLNYYTNIDLLTYQIQQSTDPGTQGSLSAQRTIYSTAQGNIQRIIDIMNTSNTNINNIYSNINNEKLLRDAFIDNRRKMTEIEVNILEDPTRMEANRQAYTAFFAALTQNVIDINASRGARNGMINLNATSIVGLVVPQIVAIRALNIGTLVFTTPTNTVNDSVPFNIDPTEFQVMPLLYGLR